MSDTMVADALAKQMVSEAGELRCFLPPKWYSVASALLLLIGVECASPPVNRSEREAPGSNRQPASFVVRLGVDTIMLEQFAAGPTAFDGEIVDRSPKTTVLRYGLSVDGKWDLTRFVISQASLADGSWKEAWAVTGDRTSDGFDIVLRDADSTTRRSVRAPPNAVPLFARSVGLYQLLTTRLRHAGTDSIEIPLLDLDSMRVSAGFIRTLGRDSVLIPLIFPRGEHARVDQTGIIYGVSGFATSLKWMTERVADLDISVLATSFAQRDVSGKSLGNYSSRDTVRATVGDVHILVDYGRPSKRGRVIFGGLVPWDQVWRTGANLATHLTTDRSIRVGELAVPPGAYTLYTIPSRTEWTLIVNRRTGQSGLVYDSSADFGRVRMNAEELQRTVEQLTITIDSVAAGRGRLTVAWDKTAAWVPISRD